MPSSIQSNIADGIDSDRLSVLIDLIRFVCGAASGRAHRWRKEMARKHSVISVCRLICEAMMKSLVRSTASTTSASPSDSMFVYSWIEVIVFGERFRCESDFGQSRFDGIPIWIHWHVDGRSRDDWRRLLWTPLEQRVILVESTSGLLMGRIQCD